MQKLDLVPGRTCGGCTVCCVALEIDIPELKKAAAVPCTNLCASGCSIHETWPDLCREWFCVWRQNEHLSEDWRPDRSGVLLQFHKGDTPEDLRPIAVRFDAVEKEDALFTQPMLTYMAMLVAQATPVFVSIPAPQGIKGRMTLLNTMPGMDLVIGARNLDGVSALVRQAIASQKADYRTEREAS